MEQVRIIVAIALSLLIFIVWDFLFVDKKQNVIQNDAITAPQGSAINDPVEMKGGLLRETVMPQLVETVKTNKPDRLITVKTPLYKVEISENRASFQSFTLNHYKTTVEPDASRLEMVDQDLLHGTVHLNFESLLAMDTNRTAFTVDQSADQMDVVDKPVQLTFRHVSGNGQEVQKRFTFFPESYLIDMTVIIANHTRAEIRDNLVISLVNEKGKEESGYGFQGPSALINNSLENIKIKKLKEQNTFPGKLDWIAYQDRYFISCVIPKNPGEAALRILTNDADKSISTQYVQNTGAILPGLSQNYDFSLYLGPKSIKILKSFDRKIDKAVDFGMFDFIAKPCLWLMNLLYGVVPNYGIAIIVLTLLTKIILWPLGSKSYKSMNEMKKIQPLMAEIREKYKDDKKRMNEETMGLYRTYKINPLGGCLPMVVQIPVFFALYRMLYEAVELRHAPFFGWINDLSAPDRLFHFDFSIPFMEAPYGIPVLTIVMGGTMFLQQKMSPPMGDPTQAKMMMLMPIIFTFIFINFSSGLVLYWLVNNVLSILQQYYIQKKYA